VATPIRVGIVLGSDSDLTVMLETVKVLDALQVGHEVVVASAHRTPRRTEEYATTAAGRGLGVLIAAAGGAAALPGVLAASSPLPVIGVPIASTPLGGMDALLSIVQMPKGVPVATVAIGAWGAANAAILAAQILAVGDAALRERLAAYRQRLSDEVDERAKRVEATLRAQATPAKPAASAAKPAASAAKPAASVD
jgi:5-(carboxyamino)imidazole ribonucleotide mutase